MSMSHAWQFILVWNLFLWLSICSSTPRGKYCERTPGIKCSLNIILPDKAGFFWFFNGKNKALWYLCTKRSFWHKLCNSNMHMYTNSFWLLQMGRVELISFVMFISLLFYSCEISDISMSTLLLIWLISYLTHVVLLLLKKKWCMRVKRL